MTSTRTWIALVTALGCAGGGDPSMEMEGVPLAGDLPPTREDAEAILTRVTALYQEHAAAAPLAGTHRLVWRVDWEDPVGHAHASAGLEWGILLTGAWLTAPSMTADAFAFSICHEAGHLVGGFPFKTRSVNLEKQGTAIATESQADYFATKDCLPRLWADDTAANAAAFAALAPAVRARCTSAFHDSPSQQRCGRILRASLQMSRSIAEQNAVQYNKELVYPALDTPELSTIDLTKEGYPSDQCRLDTLVAGAVCGVKHSGLEIPGLVAPYGEFSVASQEAARPFACGTGPGARPRCWFQPDGREFDCSTLGASACVSEDGQQGVRYCSPTTGVTHYWCTQDDVCKTRSDGVPDCYAPDVDPDAP